MNLSRHFPAPGRAALLAGLVLLPRCGVDAVVIRHDKDDAAPFAELNEFMAGR